MECMLLSKTCMYMSGQQEHGGKHSTYPEGALQRHEALLLVFDNLDAILALYQLWNLWFVHACL